MDNAENSDRLDVLLGRQDVGEQADVIRRAVLAQAAPVLRRRRVARRGAWAVALAGCYLFGAASGGFWLPQAQHTASLAATNPAGADGAAPQAIFKTPDSPTTRPVQSRFEILRNQGGHALRDQGDVEAAIRLYAQALQVATPQELIISDASDDWLLMSLKEAHTKENDHADRGES